jgi:ribosome-binding ATPase YchF (GTP1/OBG family)
LDDLRKADVLIHVIDASGSTNEKGDTVPAGSYNPAEDIKFLEREIDLWFNGILKKNWQKFGRVPFTSKKHFLETLAQGLSGLGISETHLEYALNKTGLMEKRADQWDDEDLLKFATHIRQSSKPIVIAANKMDLPEAQANMDKLQQEFPNELIIPCSAISEYTLRKAAKADFIEYFPGDKEFKPLKEMSEKQKAGLEKIGEDVLGKYGATGVQEVIEQAVFERLNYISIFPGGLKKLSDSEGNVLPDCFLVPQGSTALDFAFKLHTDIGKGFIKAVDVKKKQLIGKDYELQDGDVIEIVFKK